jgi:hypothetical protein
MTTTFDRLLDPTPQDRETGWVRLPDGTLVVNVRTDMHGVTGAAFAWWFASHPGDREYKWWHPIDHVSSSWVGDTHVVVEALTSLPATDLSVQFEDPAGYFSPGAYAAAIAEGRASVVMAARAGAKYEESVGPDGLIRGGRILHVGRDTSWGMALRSHFRLGLDLVDAGMPPEKIAEIFPDAIGPNLLQHCYDEFRFLADVLPAVYAAEGDGHQPARPW